MLLLLLTLRIGVVGLIVVWSVMILAPFAAVLLWAIIIAISAYPLFARLTGLIGRPGWSATLVVITLLLVPSLYVILEDLGRLFGIETADAKGAVGGLPGQA